MRRCKRLYLSFVLAILCTTGLAACQPIGTPAPAPPAPSSGSQPSGKTLDVAFVLPGQINDGSFNTQAYSGILRAQKEVPAKTTYVEKVAVPDAPKVIRDYAAEKHDVVWAQSGAFVNGVLQVAPDYPNTTFASLAGPGMKLPANVWMGGNEFEDAYYEAGALAGLMTKSNVLGYVGGAKIPIYAATALAFEQGAKAVNPNVKVLTTFVGSFDDPVAAKQAAAAQMDAGADIIGGALNLGYFGVFEAARAKKGTWVIGKDMDMKTAAPDVVLTSVVLDWQELMVRILKKVAAGEKGGYMPVNLASGMARLAPFYGQVPQNVVDQVEKIHQDLQAGKIKLPTEADAK